MLEWLFDALQTADQRLTGDGDRGLLVLLLVLFVGLLVLVFVHELGHALTCLLLRVPVKRLRVGGDPHVTVGRGEFRMELSLRESTGFAGFVEHGTAPLWKVAAIALGGPALDAVATVAVFAAAEGSGPLPDALWLLGALNVVSLAVNLVPWTLLAGTERWNDGSVVVVATLGALLRADTAPQEPAPAPAPAPLPAPAAPAMRRPFVVLLGACALLALMVSPPLALALVVLFASAYISQT